MTVIDAGLITSLKPDVANPFGDFLRALCASDVDTIVEKILEFNVGKQEVDEAAFRAKVKEITDHFKTHEKGGDGAKLQRRQTQGAGPHGAREERYALGDVVGEILLNLQRFKIVLRGVRAGVRAGGRAGVGGVGCGRGVNAYLPYHPLLSLYNHYHRTWPPPS